MLDGNSLSQLIRDNQMFVTSFSKLHRVVYEAKSQAEQARSGTLQHRQPASPSPGNLLGPQLWRHGGDLLGTSAIQVDGSSEPGLAMLGS